MRKINSEKLKKMKINRKSVKISKKLDQKSLKFGTSEYVLKLGSEL